MLHDEVRYSDCIEHKFRDARQSFAFWIHPKGGYKPEVEFDGDGGKGICIRFCNNIAGEIYEFVSRNDHFCFFPSDTLGDADTVNVRYFASRANLNSQRALLSASSAWLLG